MKNSLPIIISLLLPGTSFADTAASPGSCHNPVPNRKCGPCENEDDGSCFSSNPISSIGGNLKRNITDFSHTHSAGFQGLRFERMSTSRYNVGTATPMGSGANWRHNWQWEITPGLNSNSLIIDYPSGGRNEFVSYPNEPYWTAGPDVVERIEPDATDPNLFRLWFADGSHLRIEKTAPNGQDTYLATQWLDAHGVGYTLAHDSQKRLTQVTSPEGNALFFQYAPVGDVGHSDVNFTFKPSDYTNLPSPVTSVSIAGSFNGWDTYSHTLTLQADGTWKSPAPLKIQLGTWEYKVVVNHSHWVTDANNPDISSTSGNSLLTVTSFEDGTGSGNALVHFETDNFQTANTVLIAGSFNGWAGEAMTKSGGVWSLDKNIAAGEHQYKLIVDGNWQIDPDNPFTVTDPGGNTNSMRVVGNVVTKLVRVYSSANAGSVDFEYDTFSSGPALFAVMNKAIYKDGSEATYTYEPPNFWLGRPRLNTARDPRYSGSGSKVDYGFYNGGSIEGYVYSETHADHPNAPFAVLDAPSATQAKVTLQGGHTIEYIFQNNRITSKIVKNAPTDPNDPATASVSSITSTARFDNGWGMVQSRTEAGITITYDRTWHFGKITKTDYPDNSYTETVYTDANKPFFILKTRDRDGRWTNYTRDAQNRVTRIDYPDGTHSTMAYNAYGDVTSQRSRAGVITATYYDSSRRVTSRTEGTGTDAATASFTYDSLGRVATQTTPPALTENDTLQSLTLTYTYDSLNRKVRTDYADATYTTVTYNAEGEMTSRRDSRGNVWETDYDDHGRVIKQRDPLGRETVSQYQNFGAGGGCCGSGSKPTKVTSPEGIETHYSYDAQGRVITQRVGAILGGIITHTYYDLNGRVVSIENTSTGDSMDYTYDLNGRTKQVIVHDTDESNTPVTRVTTTLYTAAGRTTRTTYPDGTYSETLYDSVGRNTGREVYEADGTLVHKQTVEWMSGLNLVSKRKDGDNIALTFTYDTRGRAKRTDYPDQTFSTVTRDPSGNVTSTTDQLGNTSTARYDVYGRPVLSTDATGVWSKNIYEAGASGLLVESQRSAATGQSAVKTTVQYDAAGRRTQMTQAPGTAEASTTSWVYSDSPHTLTVNDGNGQNSVTTFDDAGRVKTTKDPLNRVTTNTYSGSQLIRQDYPDNTHELWSFKAGRLRTHTDRTGKVTRREYDARGQLAKLYLPGNAQAVQFDYNAAGQRTKRTEQDGTYQQFTYSLSGRLSWQRKADGHFTQSITYDALGRLKKKTWNSSSNPLVSPEFEEYAYDAAGRMTMAKNQDSDLAFAYDLSGRLQDETLTLAGIAKTTRRLYNGGGRIASIEDTSDASSKVTYTYGARGLFNTVSANGPPPVATYQWDGRGQMLQLQGSATVSTWNRDAAGQITSVTVNAGAAQRFARHYGYDAAGRRNYTAYGTPTSNPSGQVYAYDAKGQLTHAKFLPTGNPSTAVPTVNPTHQFSFDDSGNRQSAVTPSQGTVNYTAGNTNQYTLVTGDQPTYDANGNQTHLRSRNLTWDRRDRLRSNGNIAYTYDALGRMVQRKNTTTGATQRFTWSSWLMISEQHKDNAGNETEFLRYTWGADLTGTLEGAGAVGGLLMIEHFAAGSGTAQTAHAHADANGNIMGLTSDTGAQLTWYRYHPFGQLESQGGNSDWLTWNSFTFSSKWQDSETALHYYGYRWYDSVTGRWPSRDPLEEDGGPNLYSFVGNDGVNRADYLGLAAMVIGYDENGFPIAQGSNKKPFFGPDGKVRGIHIFEVKDLADNTSAGFVAVGVEMSRTGQFRLDYARLAAQLEGKGLSKEQANAVRDGLKQQFRNKGPAMFKAWTRQILAQRAATGHVVGRNNAFKTNAKLNSTAKVLRNTGRAVVVVGIGFEVYNVATAPPGERGDEALRAGGRVGGGILGGAGAGAALGAMGLNPWTVAAGTVVGGVLGAFGGEGIIEACIED